jgi:hypothetical protein
VDALAEKQIPFGDDNQKSISKSKGKGGFAISFELRVSSCELRQVPRQKQKRSRKGPKKNAKGRHGGLCAATLI